MPANMLWYENPAREWTDALPLGNGRLGAMVFGSPVNEHLQVNEATLWTGGPYQPVNPEARSHLAEVQALIFARRYSEAEARANDHLMARPHLQMSYQPAGDLWVDLDERGAVTEYRRGLDLATAIAFVEYRSGEITYRRESFSSAVDGVLVLRLTADRPGGLSCVAAPPTRLMDGRCVSVERTAVRKASTAPCASHWPPEYWRRAE
jgi:alpha-L-fucosidase 2